MAVRLFMVLNDEETYTELEGCTVLTVDDSVVPVEYYADTALDLPEAIERTVKLNENVPGVKRVTFLNNLLQGMVEANKRGELNIATGDNSVGTDPVDSTASDAE